MLFREFYRDNTEKCLELIEDRSIINTRDSKNGKGLLQIAIENNNLQLVKALIAKDADVNFFNGKDQSTPLFTAIQLNQLDIAQALLQSHKVEIERLIEGRTYLEHAVVIGTPQLIELLLRYKVPQTGNLLHISINANQDENSLYLIQHSIGLTNIDNDNENVLHLLAFNGNAELLNAIIKKNKEQPLNIWNQHNKDGNCPIHIAAINNKQLFLKVLLQNKIEIGLDENQQNKAGLNYQQILDQTQKRQQIEYEEQLIRKRQNAEDRKERQQQRAKEVEDKILEEKEKKRKQKEVEANKEIEQKKTENKQRFFMIGVFALILLGFYIVLQFSIKTK